MCMFDGNLEVRHIHNKSSLYVLAFAQSIGLSVGAGDSAPPSRVLLCAQELDRVMAPTGRKSAVKSSDGSSGSPEVTRKSTVKVAEDPSMPSPVRRATLKPGADLGEGSQKGAKDAQRRKSTSKRNSVVKPPARRVSAARKKAEGRALLSEEAKARLTEELVRVEHLRKPCPSSASLTFVACRT